MKNEMTTPKLAVRSGCLYISIRGKDWFVTSTSGEFKDNGKNALSDLYWDETPDSASDVRKAIDQCVSAVNQFEALNAVAEAASKLPWNKLQKADAGSVNDALCDLQNALATLNAIKAEMV